MKIPHEFELMGKTELMKRYEVETGSYGIFLDFNQEKAYY